MASVAVFGLRNLRRSLAGASALAVALSVALVPASAAPSSPLPSAADVPALASEAGDAVAAEWPSGDYTAAENAGQAGQRTAGAPAAPTLTSPAPGSVVALKRPELKAEPRAWVRYEFVIGTGESPRSGSVASSGWLDKPQWTVPAGVLKDGGQYLWTARVRDTRSGQVSEDAAPQPLMVNLRLGQQNPEGPVPTDTLGPVTANLATGNVTTQLMTPFIQSGMGPIGVQLTYNSQAVDDIGLTASYFSGDSRDGIADGETPALVRTDSQVSFFWGLSSPYRSVPKDGFRARWQGSVKVPESGSYQFGGLHDDGLRVWIGDQQVYDAWQKSAYLPAYGGAVQLEAGRAYPIRVEYREQGLASFVGLWAKREGRGQVPVPSSWLSQAGAVLPPGWSMNPGVAGAAKIDLGESTVAVTDNSGATVRYTPQADGSFKAPAGTRGSLKRDKAGKLTAVHATGATTVFSAAGTLESISAPATEPESAADKIKSAQESAPASGAKTSAKTESAKEDVVPAESAAAPASKSTVAKSAAAAAKSAAKVQWGKVDGAAAEQRVTKVKTAAADQPIELFYAGSPECADRSAPAGFLCAVKLINGAKSTLRYRDGKLVRFQNPGGEVTDLAFSREHLLTAVRNPSIMDWIRVDPRLRDSRASRFEVEYHRDGRVSALRGPEPSGFESRSSLRPQRDFSYGADSTEVRVAGLSPKQGWATRYTRDLGGRMLSSTDATGKTKRYEWTEGDTPISVTDAAGRKTTVAYNEMGMPAGTYGPGPQRCFGPDNLPRDPAPQGCEKLPAQTTTMEGPVLTTVRADSDGVPAQRTATTYDEGFRPVNTVSDPGGLNLTQAVTFNEFGQPTSVTKPTGAKTVWEYYGISDLRDNPCTPEEDPAPQWGQSKSTTLPNPATGGPRVDETVYGWAGIPVAVKLGSADWFCVGADERTRMTSQSMPGNEHAKPRRVTYDWTAGGNPLSTSAGDYNGTVTITNDLLGRISVYTDAQGTRTESTYDRAGRVVAERIVLPNPADRPLQRTTRYDDAGRVLAVKVDNQVLSDNGYDAAGELSTVAYPNGTKLTKIGKDLAGRITSLTWKQSDGRETVSAVTRSRSGTIVDEVLGGVDARPNGPNYEYDAVGRLTKAWVNGHVYSYDFTSAAPAGCPAGTQANAGLNGNRMRMVDQTAGGSTETGYCYDADDRLLGTTGANPVSGVKHDITGTLTEYTAGGRTLALGFDEAERHVSVRTTGPDAAQARYERDVFDRLIRREVKGDAGADTLLFGYTQVQSEKYELAFGADKRLVARFVSLPGGAVQTARVGADAGASTWSFPSVRGNIALTTGGDGKQVGELRTYGPYGEPLKADGAVESDQVPDNSPGQFDFGWLGQFQRPYDHAGSLFTVQVGTRPYDYTLGRYFSAAPPDNGLPNNYQYANGNPITFVSPNGITADPVS